MGTLSTLFTLPFLLIISVPLALSAWLTISFALFTLFLRLFVVYIELGLALVINFFTVPTSTSTSSFLTFAPSEPPTPAAGNSRRNSAYSLIHSRRSNDALSSWAFSAFQDDPSKRKKKNYARSMIEAHHLSTAPMPVNYTGLPVSGDERRDFEGVGGWRSYPDISCRASKARSVHSGQEKPMSPGSSSSRQSVAGDMDEDDRAWLSLNDRLELPSQVVTFGAASSVNSPTHADSMSSSYALVPAASSSYYNGHTNSDTNSDHRRHHRRSHTTSALSTSDLRTGTGLSLSLSNRPESSSSRPVSPSATRSSHLMTPQPYSPSLARSSRSLAGGAHQVNGHSNSNGGGGYFALPHSNTTYVPSFSTLGSPVSGSSGYTTPGGEERDNTRQLTRFMAHYPTSVRHRRRSLSGPHARRVSTGNG